MTFGGSDSSFVAKISGEPPTIASFKPTSGDVGTQVVINGTGFRGATAVSFGGTPAGSFTVNSSTQITAIVGAGATGRITVATPSGTAASADNFAFVPQTARRGSSISGNSPPTSPVSLPSVSVQGASLSATKVAPCTPVTVTANIANTGTVNGSARLTLYINGQEESSQGITVNSGSSTPVTFTVSRNEPGTYSVYVGGTNAGSFVVDQFADPNIILYISLALLGLAFVIGLLFILRRRQPGH
jgi:hypothetical protein